MISQLLILYVLFIDWDFSAPKSVTRVLGLEGFITIFFSHCPANFLVKDYDVCIHSNQE